MMFNWEKRGRCLSVEELGIDWMETHAQLAIPYLLDDDSIRIFFNSRTEGKTRPTYVDLDSEYNLVNIHKDPLLELGRRGTFDDRGVMFSSILNVDDKLYMYYSGWNVGTTVRYHNSIGLAISHDNGNSFRKYSDGPIMDRSVNDPIMCAGPYVIKKQTAEMKNGLYIMYYLSCSKWIEGEKEVEPVYDIHYAVSEDGIQWDIPFDNVCIKGVDEAIAQPCVIEHEGKYHMWYSYRKTDDYRNNRSNSYRIGYARSDDAISWKRMDELAGIDVSDEGWDSEMIEYPYVIKRGNDLVMFYNGNGFGQSGFGYAVAHI